MGLDRRRLLGLIAAGVVAAPAGGFAQEAVGPPFRVDLPSGFAVKARPRGPDFDLYDIVKGDVVYVGVYVGGFASFPMNAGAKIKNGPTPDIQMADSVGPDGAPRREYLIKNKNGWGVLHVWTQNPPGDQPTAARIAASVRFK